MFKIFEFDNHNPIMYIFSTVQSLVFCVVIWYTVVCILVYLFIALAFSFCVRLMSLSPCIHRFLQTSLWSLLNMCILTTIQVHSRGISKYCIRKQQARPRLCIKPDSTYQLLRKCLQ